MCVVFCFLETVYWFCLYAPPEGRPVFSDVPPPPPPPPPLSGMSGLSVFDPTFLYIYLSSFVLVPSLVVRLSVLSLSISPEIIVMVCWT